MVSVGLINLAIQNVLLRHPEYLTKTGGKGECVNASNALLFECDRLNNDEPINGCMVGDSKIPHYWALIEGVNYDLTARQFDEKADCPKIW